MILPNPTFAMWSLDWALWFRIRKSNSWAHNVHITWPMRRVAQWACTAAAQLPHVMDGPVIMSLQALQV